MFQRLKLWLSGQSGLYEATRDATRETTKLGLRDGHRLGVEDFIDELLGSEYREPTMIEAAETNGQAATTPKLTNADLRGLRKPDLIDLAAEQGLDVDQSWTVPDLKKALVPS